MPAYYNFKATAHDVEYVDIQPAPCYSFGYGLSFTNFSMTGFSASVGSALNMSSVGTFSANDTIVFSVQVANTGSTAGSTVPQVYLLQRVSQITQPVKQLVAFSRVYLDPGQSSKVQMELEVNRYLKILDRHYQWMVEKGDYTFALMDSSSWFESTGVNVTLSCAHNVAI